MTKGAVWRALPPAEWANHPLNRFRGWLAVIVVFYLIILVMGPLALAAFTIADDPGWRIYPDPAATWLAIAASLIYGLGALAAIGWRLQRTAAIVLALGLASGLVIAVTDWRYDQFHSGDHAVSLFLTLAIAAYLKFSRRGAVMFERRDFAAAAASREA